jgi:hypothetical protein
MSFHLEGPWLSTTGKRKGKPKFRSSEEARKSRELAELWEQNKKAWSNSAPKFSNSKSKVVKQENIIPNYRAPIGRESAKIPSRPDSPGSFAVKPEQKIYTGDSVLGISTLHKSNAVPVFSKEEAVSISRMRR